MGAIISRNVVRHNCRNEARTYLAEREETERKWRRGGWRTYGNSLSEPRHPTQYAPVSARMKEGLDPRFAVHSTHRRKALNRRERECRSMDRAKWPWGLLGRRIDQRWLRNRRRRTINNHIAHAHDLLMEE